MDPLSEVDGIPVGQNFYKIFVQNARKPNAHLERPRKGIAIVGESVGRHVAWKSIDVNYNFVSFIFSLITFLYILTV